MGPGRAARLLLVPPLPSVTTSDRGCFADPSFAPRLGHGKLPGRALFHPMLPMTASQSR